MRRASSDFDPMTADYPVKIEFDPAEHTYSAEFMDLPGCFATGDTVAEAYEQAQIAKEDWLRVTMEQGIPVPKPSRSDSANGRILLRLPKPLHSMLIDRAHINGTSLNQYMVHLLSGTIVTDEIGSRIDGLAARVAACEGWLSQINSQFGMISSYAFCVPSSSGQFMGPAAPGYGNYAAPMIATGSQTALQAGVVYPGAAAVYRRQLPQPDAVNL